MSAGRDTPRGPTATELRRRALAHNDEWARLVQTWNPSRAEPSARRCGYCGSMSPHGCPNGPCSFHA